MSQINLYIYNDVNDIAWEKECCGRCGMPIVDVKGKLVRRTTNVGAPQQVFKADTTYISIICRKCHTRSNILVISYEGPPLSDIID